MPRPRTLEPQPWKVGQWAAYKSRRSGQIVLDTFVVLAIDGCGTWVERITETAEHRWKWVFCFRAQPTGASDVSAQLDAVIEVVDQERPAMHRMGAAKEPQRVVAAAQLVPPDWLATPLGAREDVRVLAGTFAGAVRARSAWDDHGETKLTVWAHPGVPFGGIVKTVSDDGTYEQELVAFGEDVGAPSSVSELVMKAAAGHAQPLRPYLELGLGLTWLSRPGTADSSYGMSSLFGAPLTRDLDAIIAIPSTLGGVSAADPSLAVDGVTVVAGARRTLWRGFLDPYLQGGIGYAELEKYMAGQEAGAAHGLALELEAGVASRTGRDWSEVIHLSDTIGIYDAHEGVRHLISFSLGLQLVFR